MHHIETAGVLGRRGDGVAGVPPQQAGPRNGPAAPRVVPIHGDLRGGAAVAPFGSQDLPAVGVALQQLKMDVEGRLSTALHQRSALQVLNLSADHSQPAPRLPDRVPQSDGVTRIVVRLDHDLSEVVAIVLGAVFTIHLHGRAWHDPAEEDGRQVILKGVFVASAEGPVELTKEGAPQRPDPVAGRSDP